MLSNCALRRHTRAVAGARTLLGKEKQTSRLRQGENLLTSLGHEDSEWIRKHHVTNQDFFSSGIADEHRADSNTTSGLVSNFSRTFIGAYLEAKTFFL
jgi:hypothetical protein